MRYGGVHEGAGEGAVALLVEGGDEVQGGLDLVEDALRAGEELAVLIPVGVSCDAGPLRARRARETRAQSIDEAVGGMQG